MLKAALTIPNLLTYLRIAGALGLLAFGLLGRWDAAFPIFLFAAGTDLVDGTFARVLNQRTRLGAFLDPVADKTLMFASFLTLTIGGFLPVALTALVFTRDVLISVGLYILKRSKVKIVYNPTYLSKITTFFQILTVLGAFGKAFAPTQDFSRYRGFFGDLPYDTLWTIVLAVTAVLTAVTAVQYIRIGRRLLHEKKRSSGG